MVSGVAVLVVAVAVVGCGSERVTGGGRPVVSVETPAVSAGTPAVEGYCPPVEAQGSGTPGPCVSESEQQRFAENHAYASQFPATAGQQQAAQAQVRALEAGLQGLAGKSFDEGQLMAATTAATGGIPGWWP